MRLPVSRPTTVLCIIRGSGYDQEQLTTGILADARKDPCHVRMTGVLYLALLNVASVVLHFQGGDKGLLGNVDLAELAHAFLAGLLFVQQLGAPSSTAHPPARH